MNTSLVQNAKGNVPKPDGNNPISISKLTIMRRKNALVTQMRLARIQELQASILRHHEAQLSDQRELRKEWTRLRYDILSGVAVERGPLHALLKGKKKKRLVIK